MKIFKIKDMKGGWFIGNFEPNAFKTDQFEVGYKFHPKDDNWDSHYHKIINEITLVASGRIIINDITFEKGDIFVIEPNEPAIPQFTEDCELLIIKVPSVPGDKYIIK